MANAISQVQSQVSASPLNADNIGAIVRTALSKSGSSKSIKSKATVDSRQIDGVRGSKYEISSLVFLNGTIAIDGNGTYSHRLDRVKLLGQAVIGLLRDEKPVNQENLKVEMKRLYDLYFKNPDLKQPDSDSFDDMIAGVVSREAVDGFKEAVRTTPKSGDFSTADLTITVLGTECLKGESLSVSGPIDSADENTLKAVKRLLKVSEPKRPASPPVERIAGGENPLYDQPKRVRGRR